MVQPVRAKLLGALALVLTTSVLGCGPMVRRLGEQAGQFTVGGLVGVPVAKGRFWSLPKNARVW